MDSQSELHKKLFDASNYHTLIIGNESEDSELAGEESALTGVEGSQSRNEFLKLIKQDASSLETLKKAIQEPGLASHKISLLAACWESGIDCRGSMLFFVDQAVAGSVEDCIECLSVIDGMEPPVDQLALTTCFTTLQKAIAKESGLKKDLLLQLQEILNGFKD